MEDKNDGAGHYCLRQNDLKQISATMQMMPIPTYLDSIVVVVIIAVGDVNSTF